MEYLYHGSTVQDLAVIEPRKRFTPAGKIEYAAIYASPNPAFAAVHSFPWSSDDGIDIRVDGNNLTLMIPKAELKRLAAPVSIYKISADNFEMTKEEETGLTWHTTQQTPILEETQYSSVREALEALGVQIQVL